MGPSVQPPLAPATMKVPEEPDMPVVYDRWTKSGRHLWYHLRVIQQPERARACGSGPKSSADRRPVDPPPVAELRIFEGQTWEQAREKDITFLYNANFFLYATLEHSRAMAQGRVPTPSTNIPPVLTGLPVSGMAYLDRPSEAGYFLFPDLSVRHEGRYRFSFNLYEQTKEDKDKDPDVPDSEVVCPGLSVAEGGSFDWRMEVKSHDFVVYSAKKFPGLAESTSLSRVFGEQGCRVRIRRDVRMRRRDGKGGSGAGDYEAKAAEEEYVRRKRTETPEPHHDPYRARSMSGSVERTPYSAESVRRASIVDYPSQYASQPPSAGGHLGFLGGNPGSQYPAQPQSFAQPPPSVPSSPSYPPPPSAPGPGPGVYASQSSYPLPPPPYQSERSSYSAERPLYPSEMERPSSRQYSLSNQPLQREGMPMVDQRRPSFILPPPPPPSQASFPSMMHGHNKPVLPPITTLQNPMRMNGSMSSPSMALPNSDLMLHPTPPKYAGLKRGRGDQMVRPDDYPRLQNGARESELIDPELKRHMPYRRADGSLGQRMSNEMY